MDVSLTATRESLTIDIRDNGSGTDLAHGHRLGHGLVGIRERTLLLGGRMEIESTPGNGFALSIGIPLDMLNSTGGSK